MASRIDQAWEDMKSPEAAKTRAYASRVKWILNGSKPADARSARANRTGAQLAQRENISFVGLESGALESPASSSSHVHATCPHEPIGEGCRRRSVSAGTYHILLLYRKLTPVHSSWLMFFSLLRYTSTATEYRVQQIVLRFDIRYCTWYQVYHGTAVRGYCYSYYTHPTKNNKNNRAVTK